MTEEGPARRDLLLDGGEALRRGAWAEAREHFEAALRERETAQALEGLGMAAQWLVDRETVFVARERAYRLYRERQCRATPPGSRSSSRGTTASSEARRRSRPAGCSAPTTCCQTRNCHRSTGGLPCARHRSSSPMVSSRAHAS